MAADAELKPTKLGMMPFDLRSELKSKLGGGFNLKKSSTNVDIFSNSNNRKVAEKTAETSTSELLRSLRDKQGKIVDENGQENLSFKEKLKLIEKSSQLALLPPA